MQEYLITTADVAALSRDMSKHIDEDRIRVYIRESEDIDIRPALGDGLFVDIKKNSSKYDMLLNGGTYTGRCGEVRVVSGIKKALAYYAYARMVKNTDNNLTRFGFVSKDSDYSHNIDFKSKLMAYNDAFIIADKYLKECVMFLNENKDDYPLYKGCGNIKSNRVVYKIIGD